MLDAFRPWFFVLWGVALLIPLVITRQSRVWGHPLTRSRRPRAFWMMLLVGTALVLTGAYGVWAQVTAA